MARWVVLNKRSFNIVEGAEFVDMLGEANPRFIVPGRKAVRALADKLYNSALVNVRSAVNMRLQFCPAYTADMWSASDG